MTAPVTHFVDISVSMEQTGAPTATFGVPLFLFESSVQSSTRLHGPFSVAQAGADLVTFGYTAGSAPVLFAQALAGQSPRVKEYYIGRADSGDADITASLDAIYAESPGAWYCTMMESRASEDILLLAAWTETKKKIAIAQSNDASILSGLGPTYNALFGGTATDGTYILTFTGFGLVSPVTVTITRSTTPATNSDLATAFRSQLTTQAGTDLDGVIVDASIGGAGANVEFRLIDGLASGTIVASGTSVAGAGDLTVTTLDQDIASRLFALQYTRTALVYHATDAEYLDAAWASRCLSFNLDVRKGSWAFKQLTGFDGAELSAAQMSALRAVNCNVFAPAAMDSGLESVAFTSQGWVAKGNAGAGRRIDTVITLDWTHARLQEAVLSVLLQSTYGVPYDDEGIQTFVAAVDGVLSGKGISAKHYVPKVIPAGSELAGTQTPYISAPRFADTTSAERQARTLTMSAIAYLAETIEKVVFSLEVRQ